MGAQETTQFAKGIGLTGGILPGLPVVIRRIGQLPLNIVQSLLNESVGV